MSSRFRPAQVAGLRNDARVLVERTGDHEGQLEALVQSAEQDMRQAGAAVSHAMHIGVDDLRILLYAQAERAAETAVKARQLSVSARQQHGAARRLLNDLDSDQPTGEPHIKRQTNVVLVVDDYGEVRELVARVLENAGFVVSTAANGLEGLIAAYEMRPGVIVMDVSMPVLDGIEATRLIKASEATRHARVIAYTGNALLGNGRVQGLFAAVIQKPAPVDLVLATVRHVANL